MTDTNKTEQEPRSGLSDLTVGLERIMDDLVRVVNAYEGKGALFSCQGQGMDGYSALANFIEIAKKARELRSNTKLTGATRPVERKG